MSVNVINLAIAFDDSEPTYQPGDPITGVVRVDPMVERECRELRITCHWKTHGRGTPAEGSHRDHPLFSGPLTPGEPHEYPFEVELPNGPCTYHGHYLNVDWVLCAIAEFADHDDIRVEKDFRVVPGWEVIDRPYQIGHDGDDAPLTATDRTQPGLGRRSLVGPVAFFSFFIGICVVFLVVVFKMMGAADGEDAFHPLMMIPFIAVPAFMIFVALGTLWRSVLRNRFSAIKLGELEASLDPLYVHAGRSTTLTIAIPESSDVTIREIAVTLRGEEWVRYRQGTNTRVRTDLLHEENHIVPGSRERRLPEGEAADMDYELTIPPEAPPTFRAHHNEVRWLVEVHVDIAGWPDWKHTLHLDVYPAIPDDASPAPFPADAGAGDDDTDEALW